MSPSHHTISDRDLELLSAYLDGEVAPDERESLERRLAADPALHDALDGLQQTQALLRDLPRLRAPRNFTLDPAVYGRKPRGWRRLLETNFALQFGGALGTAAATILIVAGLLTGRAPESTQIASLKDEAAAPPTAVGFAANLATEVVESAPTASPPPTATLTPSTVPTIAAFEAQSDAESDLGQPDEALNAAEAEEPAESTAIAISPEAYAAAPQGAGEDAAGQDGIAFAPQPSSASSAPGAEEAGAVAPLLEAGQDTGAMPTAPAPPIQAAREANETALPASPTLAPTATEVEAPAEAPEPELAVTAAPTEIVADDTLTAERAAEARHETGSDTNWPLVIAGVGVLVISAIAFITGRRRSVQR